MPKKAKSKAVSLKGLYPVIGEFVIQYAIVQGTLRSVLLRLLGVTGSEGAILVYGMGDSVIAKKLKLALTRHGRNFIKFEPALKHLKDITAFRDQLIHWMPFTDGNRTTLSAIVDIMRDYKSVNQPALNFAPKQMRGMIEWLRKFEWDLATLVLAIDQNEALKVSNYHTLDHDIFPEVPKAAYGLVEMSNENSQSERFKEAARELGCDDNEEAVDELMKRVASSPPPRKGEKTSPNKVTGKRR